MQNNPQNRAAAFEVADMYPLYAIGSGLRR